MLCVHSSFAKSFHVQVKMAIAKHANLNGITLMQYYRYLVKIKLF